MERTANLAGAVRALRGSQDEAVLDVKEKIARLERLRPWSPRLREWRAVLAELRKESYR